MSVYADCYRDPVEKKLYEKKIVFNEKAYRIQKVDDDEYQKIGLKSCFSCGKSQLYVELNENKTGLFLGCHSCDNSVFMRLNEVPGFHVDIWENFETRDRMYKKLDPLFGRWNIYNISGWLCYENGDKA